MINSLDWSPVHPFLIATTSADQFRAICVWDLRDMSRPVRSMESLCKSITYPLFNLIRSFLRIETDFRYYYLMSLKTVIQFKTISTYFCTYLAHEVYKILFGSNLNLLYGVHCNLRHFTLVLLILHFLYSEGFHVL